MINYCHFPFVRTADFPIVTFSEISVSSLSMTTTKPVLIVGAGPTGMMAAIELNRFGIPVRLIDKLMPPRLEPP